MTKRLYRDGNAVSCEAHVLAVEAYGDTSMFEALTDVTVIFPESGGQLSDTGSMGDAKVLHAREDGEDVWHLIDKPLKAGDTVIITADENARRDHSQQHTGEHILSGLAHKLFSAHNVGFHMAEDYCTLDIDAALTDEQLTELTLAANAAVQKNIPVRCETVDAEELETRTLRKQAAGLSGEIHIVYIDGVDSCTCCGTHCANTGEVGAILITAHMKYKGGTRIWFACGMRAVNESVALQNTVSALGRRFSVKDEDVEEAVLRQGDELTKARHLARQRTASLMAYKARELDAAALIAGSTRLILYADDGFTAQELRGLGEKLTLGPGRVAALFSREGESVSYLLMRSKDVSVSMKELCLAVNAALNGRGGGKEDMAQGSAKAAAGFDEAMEQLKRYFVSVLGQ